MPNNEMARAVASCAIGGLIKGEPGAGERRYRFGADFLGFQGHFPSYPILPAFIQLMAAHLLAEEINGGPLRLAAVENAKFQRRVFPGQEILVGCRRRLFGGATAYEARITGGGEQVAVFMLIVESQP